MSSGVRCYGQNYLPANWPILAALIAEIASHCQAQFYMFLSQSKLRKLEVHLIPLSISVWSNQ